MRTDIYIHRNQTLDGLSEREKNTLRSQENKKRDKKLNEIRSALSRGLYKPGEYLESLKREVNEKFEERMREIDRL